ncbi:MAG: ABC transporter substrate-binding protein [Candidatus Woesearchaeota archaeon]|nr:ABC transporter substrate-binding protein [Candidatus Woesearchaeota archaeon]
MEKKQIWIGILVVVLVGTAIGLLFAQGSLTGLSVQEKNEVLIGFIGPLSGDASIVGEVEKNAAEIAVEEINQKGGIKGKKIRMIYEDGKCNGKDASIAANKLITIDKLKILFVVCSAENLAVAPLAEKNKVIQFAAWASHPDITDAGEYVFRNAQSDSQTAELAAKTIYLNYKNIGEIYELTDYSQGLHREFNKNIELLGGTVISEGFLQGSNDMKTEITKILRSSPEAIFVNPNTPVTGLILLKQVRELGFKGQIYGNFFGSAPQVVESEMAQGMIFFSEPTVEENEIKKKLFEKYKSKYGSEPAFSYPVAARYDTVYIIAEAIAFCNSDKKTECIKDYIYAIEEFKGALGTYSFDEHGDVVGVIPSTILIQNGKMVVQ